MSIQEDQQAILEAEAALQALGISSDIYSQALQQLVKRRNALQDIQKVQQYQFNDTAFKLLSKVQQAGASSDKVVVASQFLRSFAVYISTQILILQSTYNDAETIVDHILPPTGGD